MNRYYKLPLAFQNILDKKELHRCSLKESIAQHIHLILMTHYEEYRLDKSYGSEIWEQDFEMLKVSSIWKDKIADSLQRTIANHERRLTSVRVKTVIGQEEFDNTKQGVRTIKKRMDVSVTGNLSVTNDSFYFEETIYISPISMD